MERTVAVIDLKSFYASCECVARHLDPLKTPLVCCDPYRSDSSVVMSVSPYLKRTYRIPNVCRKKDLPSLKGLIYAVPRMSYYLRMSAKIIAIFLEYVAMEDIHVYSVDESFLELTPYLRLYRRSPEVLVREIQKKIKERTGITATAGIADNMFLAKCSLDLEGKKKPPYISHWKEENAKEKLASVYPLSSVWGIAEGISRRLHSHGIRTFGDLSMANEEMLREEFGLMGSQLKAMANGHDEARIGEGYVPQNPSLTLGQTLNRGYGFDEITLLLQEMAEELSRRLRSSKQTAAKVGLVLQYEDGHTHFSRERSLLSPTDDINELTSALLAIHRASSSHLPVRALSIAFERLGNPTYEQLSLLEDPEESLRRRNLAKAEDMIKSLYGRDAVLPCSSLLASSTLKMRHGQIGGHKR